MISCSFSLPCGGSVSPFPHGTISLSVIQEYLALRGGPRGFTRDFTCPMLLGIRNRGKNQKPQDFHLLWCRIQLLYFCFFLVSWVFFPRPLLNKSNRFRLFPFRSPLLRKSRLLSLPLLTKMFQFSKLSLPYLWIQQGVLQVSPFGYLRILACFQLPEAFRRYPRPSSSLNA